MSASRVATLPFEHLPNLPKAVIPTVELEVDPVNWDAVRLEADSSGEGLQRLRTYTADRPTQTDETELGEVKEVARVLDELLESVGNLRRDLNFAQSVMKAEYESKLMQRAIELHHSAGTRIADIEKEHKEKLEKVRKSYHILLTNAVKRICAEYKDYYEDLLSGKSGRHDLIIKKLKERVIELETLTQEQESTIDSLNQRVSVLEKEKLAAAESTVMRTPSPVTPPPITGISVEEAEELRLTISELKDELTKTRVNLGRVETSNAKLSQQVKELVKDVEDERRRAQQLKKDLDVSRVKARADKEKAEAMAKDQKDALEKQMKDQMSKLMEDSKRKADREAELQRMRDQAKDEQERARRKALEEQLARERDERANMVVEPVEDTGLLSELERLRKVEGYQKKEIARLQAEVDGAGRTSELKVAIMQKNFHAFKDEAFIRKTLQRQAAQLHHATVAYASDGSVPSSSVSPGLKSRPLPKIPGAGQVPFQEDYYAFSVHKPLPDLTEESSHALPQAPSPSPRHMSQGVVFNLAVQGSRPGTNRSTREEPHPRIDHPGPT